VVGAELSNLDEHAAATIEYARKFSERARLGHIGTEHLLLGLMDSGNSSAVRALAGLGVTLEKVEAEMVEQSMTTQRIILSDTMASSLADAVLRAAQARAAAAGRPLVDTTDLLVSLVQERDGVASKVLAALGVGPEEVARALSGES
jgi:ATP-dependent Clp protease ATP-binding subunit ClpC